MGGAHSCIWAAWRFNLVFLVAAGIGVGVGNFMIAFFIRIFFYNASSLASLLWLLSSPTFEIHVTFISIKVIIGGGFCLGRYSSTLSRHTLFNSSNGIL
jgi:hypothetical protein